MAMKKRAPVIVITALALAAVVFLATRSPEPETDSAAPRVTAEAATADRARPPESAAGAGQNSPAPRDSAVVFPAANAPVANPALGTPREPSALPYPVNQPVVVGSRTFVPKEPPPPSDPQAAGELDKVRSMLRDYRTLYHENPVGTNAEIMQAVMGGNPKQARLGPPEGQTLSSGGELMDRWGTPYFFHQLSSELMEIRSAGPDKTLWTSDDVVTK